MKLLQDILVVDFSQFLSGPSASLRLADMGAEVVKVERPGLGEIGRHLYVSDTEIEGESSIFHAINRNKKCITADLKDKNDLDRIKHLLSNADVMIHNFRPGVMERIGLDYETVKEINPAIIYGELNGFGADGPWRDLPGQDLLLQAASGLTWLTGNKNDAPTPMGVSVVDIMSGAQLVQGILAAFFKRGISGKGALVQINMLESILSFQFESLTCFYNDGHQLPVRSAVCNANAYIGAPYGVYKTSDGYMAISMSHIIVLAKLIHCDPLLQFDKPGEWFEKRDEIKKILAEHLKDYATAYWLEILEKADIWCAPVLNYQELMQTEGYKALEMEMVVKTGNGLSVRTTRCPIRVDGEFLNSEIGAPLLGQHNDEIGKEMNMVKAEPHQ